MPPRLCCCQGDCLICEDDFSRPDENPVTGSWEAIGAAEWEVQDETLRHVVEGPIITTCRPVASTRPNTEYSIKMYFRLIDVADEDEFKVICGYIDANNFHWIKLLIEGTSVWPEFMIRSGGVDTVLMDRLTHPGGIPFPFDTVTNTWSAKICYSENDWTIDASSGSNDDDIGNESQESETQWTLTGGGGLGSLAPGLGPVGFLFGEFDDFALHYHWEANVACDYCSCICRDDDDIDNYDHFPECLLATFIPLFDPALYPCALNDASILMRQGTVDAFGVHNLSPRKYVWQNEDEGLGTPEDMQAFFLCNNSSGAGDTKYSLCLAIPSLTGTYEFGDGIPMAGFPCATVDWTESTCNPLVLAFKELSADYTTCEIVPGVGPQGVKNPLCKYTGCIAENDTNKALINSLRWKVVVTEC